MKKLHFTYLMKIEYSVPVSRCHYTIKCIPEDNLRQRIENVQIQMTPESEYRFGTDGFGNKQLYGVNETEHSVFIFQIEGTALTGLDEAEAKENEDLDMVFRHPYGLSRAGDEIRAYYKKIAPPAKLGTYNKALKIMHCLHRDFEYRPGTTDVNTDAETALRQGYGVCQDYAHIMIALLRLAGIPARYVTGLIVGEGQSHAWVEILCDGKWYGLDPTNDTVVRDEQIRIGAGRDARDCMINRGIMHGGGLHTQLIQVSVADEG